MSGDFGPEFPRKWRWICWWKPLGRPKNGANRNAKNAAKGDLGSPHPPRKARKVSCLFFILDRIILLWTIKLPLLLGVIFGIELWWWEEDTFESYYLFVFWSKLKEMTTKRDWDASLFTGSRPIILNISLSTPATRKSCRKIHAFTAEGSCLPILPEENGS